MWTEQTQIVESGIRANDRIHQHSDAVTEEEGGKMEPLRFPRLRSVSYAVLGEDVVCRGEF